MCSKQTNSNYTFHCNNEVDKYIQNFKPIINEDELSNLTTVDGGELKYDKEALQLLNFILTKFARIVAMDSIENKYFEKSRHKYTYRNKSVSVKHIVESFYLLPEFENLSKLMDINKVAPLLDQNIKDTITKKVRVKKEMGSSRSVQLNKHFEIEDDPNENNIHPLLYNQVDNFNNFLKKTKYSHNENDNETNK
ncbi:hypothetical protein DICPUDRAFT_92092 [Dictyostelium purpureum]|uniref:Uncharacterized protein n=1 Tax=Dictyostelium purpureum TaxID=5786 RepID=F0ZLX4_DICPU|nr:uncharacterized protein DICPUDRAFT_92092 [Dictyostelium purpureum]EGC35063.1 hypothetical protein DICPUDRAFT_92092 [Dictyostelium purpureum]|eukprot:XP_003288431.1 hypothetical protein DICPUDRAFT_92092 [Dictyostelium purpureum]